MSTDHYKALEINRRATDKEIRAAFRRQAMRYHPDRNKDSGATEKFVSVREAYEVLIDPARRQRYDSTLSYSATGSQPTGEAGTGNSHSRTREEYERDRKAWAMDSRRRAMEDAALPFADFARKAAAFGADLGSSLALVLVGTIGRVFAWAAPLFGLASSIFVEYPMGYWGALALATHVAAALSWAYYLYGIDMEQPSSLGSWDFRSFDELSQRQAMFLWLLAYLAFDAATLGIVFSIR